MPPAQRTPSLPGATQASKKAFKPPARVASDTTGASSSSNPRPLFTTASTLHRANAASRAAAGDGARSAATAGDGRPTTGGFTRVSELDDIEFISSDDDDDDDDDDDNDNLLLPLPPPKQTKPLARTAAQRHDTSAMAPAAANNKRIQQPRRLPSLSPSSTASTPPSALRPANDSHEKDTATTLGAAATVEARAIGTEADLLPLLPAPLLTRLLHESFDDKSTNVTRQANSLVARYLDIFVREAVARATEAKKGHQARDEFEDENDVWLDTKDLEDVAPGLVMDF